MHCKCNAYLLYCLGGDIMAEFCFDCFKEMMETEDEQWRYILTNELELCEGCGQYKKVVIVERRLSRVQKALFPKRKVRKKEKDHS